MVTRIRIAIIIFVISLVTVVLAPLQIAALHFNWPMRCRLPRLWHRIACSLLGIRLNRINVVAPHRPLMIAANHTSWLDILVLGAAADVVFVAKSEVATWPVFSILAKLQGTIFIAREDKRKTGHQVNEIARRMAGGEIVVLFPEGTTSDGNRLLPLKSSLFGAVASAIPLSANGIVYIQPVSVAYTKIHGMALGRYHRPIAAWPGDVELMPHLGTILKMGALDAEITFCPVIACSSETNRKQLARQIEDEIGMALLQSLRDPR